MRRAARFVNACIERRVAAGETVDRQCADHDRGIEQRFRCEQAVERQRETQLRAVDQREPFLGFERDRFEPRRATHFRAFERASVLQCFAFADQAQRQVRERREIARRADRAAARNHRQHVVVEQREQRIDQLGAHTRDAGSKAVRLEQQHAPHDRRRERLADAARVTAHEIELQLPHLVRGDALVRERAEAGGDAVAHAIGAHRVAHDFDAALHVARALARSRRDRCRRVSKRAQDVERKRLAVDDQSGCTHGVQSTCQVVASARSLTPPASCSGCGAGCRRRRPCGA